MRSQIKLGSVFGIKIGIHYSWFLIAFLIVISLIARFRVTNPAWGQSTILAVSVATGVLFFVFLLLHELAHSVFAKSHGIPVREITLFALGGVSQIERNPVSARAEFWMAFVGPLSSAVIGVVCLLVRGAAGAPKTPGFVMLTWLGYINLALAVFNMIPGYPLDGGRVLRALLWWKNGNVERSTRQAARVGQVVGGLFIAFGIFQFFAGAGFGGLWTAIIGWFVLQAAGQSLLEVGLTHLLQGTTVADVMNTSCPTVDGNLSVQRFVEDRVLRTGEPCYVVVDNTGPAGLVTSQDVKSFGRARWPYLTLFDVMRPLNDVRAVQPATPLRAALEIMGRENLNQLPVVSDHHLDGVLTRAQLINYLHNRQELAS